jgi:peroxiredoxin
LDNDRIAAGKVEFFFYPTTYILDRDGEVRFAGECDIEKIKTMVAEISAEPAGAKKKMYTPKTLDVGSVAGDVSLPDADGRQVKLSSICTNGGAILFFSTTTCPFSVKALDDLERVKADFKTNKLSAVIVSFGQSAADVKALYAEKSPGSVILIDADKKISTDSFGVSAVPYFYVIGSDMKVAGRSPFVYDTARAAVAKAVGSSCSTNAASCVGAG